MAGSGKSQQAGVGGPHPQAAGPSAAPARKRRRLRVPAALAVVLAAIIWSVPYLLSTGPGTSLVGQLASGRVRGTVSIEELSLSWLGPSRVSGLRVLDADGRDTLHAAEVTCTGGLWWLLTDAERFGRVDVVSPRATLYLDPGGTPSLLGALAPAEARPQRERTSAAVAGAVSVAGGRAKVVRPNGQAYELRDVNTTILLEAPDSVKGQVTFLAQGGGTVSADFAAGGWLSGNRAAPARAEGSFDLHTSEPVNLEALLAFVGGPAQVTGRAQVNLGGQFRGPELTAKLDVRAENLHSAGIKQPAVRPIDLNLAGEIAVSARRVAARMKLGGQAGHWDVDFVYRHAGDADRPPDGRAEPSGGQLLAALLRGEPVTLPDLELDASGRVDLPRLGQAVPSLLKLLPNVRITSGTLHAARLSIRGGQKPLLQGQLRLEGLAATRGGQRLSCRPISLAVDALLSEGPGLRINQASLQSSFATLEASGTTSKLRVSFEADLAEAHRELGTVFDLGALPGGGTLTGRAELDRRGEDRVDVTLDAAARDFEYSDGDRTVRIGLGRIHQEGYLLLAGRRLAEAGVTRASLELDEDLKATATGKYDFEKQVFRADLDVKRADLAGLTRRCKALKMVGVDLELPALAGQLTGTAALSAARKDRVDFTADVAAGGVAYRSGERRIDVRKASVTVAGHLETKDHTPVSLTVTGGALTIPDELEATYLGRYDFRQGALRATVRLARGNLASLLARAELLGAPVQVKGRYTGTLQLAADLARPGRTAPFSASGTAALADFRVDDRAIAGDKVALEWSDLKYWADAGRVEAAAAKLQSEIASAQGQSLRVAFGEDLLATGSFHAEADLAACLAAAGPLAGWDKPPAVAGRLTWTGQGSSKDRLVRISGKGRVDGLRIGEKDKALGRKDLTFTHRLVVDNPGETITLDEFDLASGPLSLTMRGTIAKFRTERVLDLAGRYDGRCEDLMDLLGELAGGATGAISLAGKTGGDIRITGPAHRPKDRPAFLAVVAGTNVGWERAEIWKVPLGGAHLAPVLRNGQVHIPDTTVNASGGKVRLGGLVDLRPETPVYRAPGRRQVLEDLQITRELSQELLARFNPVFSQLAGVDGRVSLAAEDIELPLGEAIRTGGAGRGRLDFRKLKLRPDGILQVLLGLARRDLTETMPVLAPGMDFAIRRGRIHYDNFTMVFPGGIDLRFYGSVGFDDTVDLAVSVPVGAPLLERFGATGPVLDYARLLAGVRVAVPIMGTRLEPRLALDKVDIAPLIQRAVQALLAERAAELLGDILKEPRPDGNRPEEKKQPDRKPKTDEIESVLDTLLDLLNEPAQQPDPPEKKDKP